MFGLGPTELIVVLLIIAFLFGGKKIPELARGLGKGISEFKKGVNEANDEIQQVAAAADVPPDESSD